MLYEMPEIEILGSIMHDANADTSTEVSKGYQSVIYVVRVIYSFIQLM